jgi:hypothetical protein
MNPLHGMSLPCGARRAPFLNILLLTVLLVGAVSPAGANIPGKPIDRPEGPPEDVPTEIGEPDNGHELVLFVLGGQVLLLRMPSRLAHLLPVFVVRVEHGPVRNPNRR